MRFSRLVRVAGSIAAGVVAIVAIVVSVEAGGAIAYAALAPVPALSRDTPPSTRRERDTLVVIGDSLAYGFGAPAHRGWVDEFRRRLQARSAGTSVVDLAVCGATVPQVEDEIARAPQGDAGAVFVVAGSNDALLFKHPLGLAWDERSLLSRIRRRFPGARILLSNVPDFSWRAFRPRAGEPPRQLGFMARTALVLLTDVDDTVIARTASRFGARVLDLHDLVVRGEGADAGIAHLSADAFDARYISADGLHPNARGYALLADFAWPAIARAMDVRP
jgi:lysophospholipase L1-like esterase